MVMLRDVAYVVLRGAAWCCVVMRGECCPTYYCQYLVPCVFSASHALVKFVACAGHAYHHQ